MNPVKNDETTKATSSSISSNTINQKSNANNSGLISTIVNVALSIFNNSGLFTNSQIKTVPDYEKIGRMTEREKQAYEDYTKAYLEIQQYEWEEKQKRQKELENNQKSDIKILSQAIVNLQNENRNLKHQVEEIKRDNRIKENIIKTKI